MTIHPGPVGRQVESADTDQPSRFTITIDDLVESVQVPLEEQTLELPASGPGRAPGDDDFTRNQRAVINPGA